MKRLKRIVLLWKWKLLIKKLNEAKKSLEKRKKETKRKNKLKKLQKK